MDSNLKDPTDIDVHEKSPSASLKIGGFLIIVAIWLVIGFVGNLSNLGWALVPTRGDVWEKLTTPGFSSYHPYWKSAITFSIISASIGLALNTIGLVLFFRKHRFFPTFIVVAILVIFVLMVAGYYLDGLVPAIAASQGYVKERHNLIVKFLAMHVWIPYFVISDRVKRTFVRRSFASKV